MYHEQVVDVAVVVLVVLGIIDVGVGGHEDVIGQVLRVPVAAHRRRGGLVPAVVCHCVVHLVELGGHVPGHVERVVGVVPEELVHAGRACVEKEIIEERRGVGAGIGVSLNATSMTRTLASPSLPGAIWRVAGAVQDWNGPGSDPVFQGAGGTRSRGPSVETGAGGASARERQGPGRRSRRGGRPGEQYEPARNHQKACQQDSRVAHHRSLNI